LEYPDVLVDLTNGNGIYVSDGNGMGIGMKSLKWEGIGMKNLYPHISTPSPRGTPGNFGPK